MWDSLLHQSLQREFGDFCSGQERKTPLLWFLFLSKGSSNSMKDTSSVTSNQRQTAVIYTQTAAGGGKGGWIKRRMDYGCLYAELQLMLPIAIRERLLLQLGKTHSGNRQSGRIRTDSSISHRVRINMDYSFTSSIFFNLSQDWSNSGCFAHSLLVCPKALGGA